MKVLSLFILLLALPVSAQKLTTAVSQDRIFIGEEIILTYTVEHAKNDSIKFQEKRYEIECYYISDNSSLKGGSSQMEITQEFFDTTITNRRNQKWIGKYTITAWDSGQYVIPEQRIQINDSTFTFRPVTVTVSLTEDLEDVDIYDIRERQAKLPPAPLTFIGFLKTYWWALVILVAGLIVVLIYWRKKNQREPERINSISLKDKTILAIESLEERKLWEQNQLKQHFVELSLILRMYLSSRYQISLLDKTTYEAKLLLTQVGLEDETTKEIVKILSESDMVKFAKSKPDIMAILKVSALAKQIVVETSPLEFDNVE